MAVRDLSGERIRDNQRGYKMQSRISQAARIALAWYAKGQRRTAEIRGLQREQ